MRFIVHSKAPGQKNGNRQKFNKVPQNYFKQFYAVFK